MNLARAAIIFCSFEQFLFLTAYFLVILAVGFRQSFADIEMVKIYRFLFAMLC